MTRTIIAIILLLGLLGVIVGGLWSLDVLEFQVTASDFLDKMLPLFLVSLLIERTLEIFITTWRGADTDQHDLTVQRALRGSQAPGIKPLDAPLQAEADRTAYKASTQRIALSAGMTLGIAISMLGLRALGQFLAPGALTAFRTAHPLQAGLFTAMDILLTGAVVGGGSDGLHKIISMFTSVAEATTQKAKGTV